MLQRLKDVDGRRKVSSLKSVRSMLDRVYPSLGRDEGAGEVGGEQPEGDMAPLLAAGYVVDLVEPCVAHIHQQFTSNLVCTSTKTFPFIFSNTHFAGSIADLLVSSSERVCGDVSTLLYIIVMATGHTPRLLTLLGDPVVSYNLQQKKMDSESKRTVEAIMVETADLRLYM